jgi:hypothetical protein
MSRRWGMKREQLQVALAHLRCQRPWAEIAEDVAQIQAGLHARLGCPVTVEEAILLWKRLPQALYGALWLAVEAGYLDLCAQMVQAAVLRTNGARDTLAACDASGGAERGVPPGSGDERDQRS